MVEHRHHRSRPGGEAPRLEAVDADDALLTALSRGEDPTSGADPAAAALLALRAEVSRPAPPPLITGAGRGAVGAPVADLDVRRAAPAPGRRGGGVGMALRYGLVGAAAAILLIAGVGVSVYNADEDSPLYALSAEVFGDRRAMVELANTLDEIDAEQANGNGERANSLLDRARGLLRSLDRRGVTEPDRREADRPGPEADPRERREADRPAPPPGRIIVERDGEGRVTTVTRKPEPPAEPAPAFTITITVTEVVTAPAGDAGPAPGPGGGDGDAPQEPAEPTAPRAWDPDGDGGQVAEPEVPATPADRAATRPAPTKTAVPRATGADADPAVAADQPGADAAGAEQPGADGAGEEEPGADGTGN